MKSEVKKQLLQKPFAPGNLWSALNVAKKAAENAEDNRRAITMKDPAIERFTKAAGLTNQELKALQARWECNMKLLVGN